MTTTGGQTCPSPLTWDANEHISSRIVCLVLIGVAIGMLITISLVYIFYTYRQTYSSNSNSLAIAHAEDCRRRLPDTLILIRHGESQANADKSMWIQMPDNLLGLTPKGREQAALAGQRVEQILQQQDHQDDHCCRRVHLIVSPFERSLQTAAALRPAIEHRIVRTDIESRIREQEMGNLQNDAALFQQYRHEQEKVGRFWYRFPTGESGSDVLDRVKSWWYESVQTVNTRVGYEPVQAMVVVSHGLTMRFILMQLFGWSPTTFHSVWNAGNCQMYVLKKDLSKPGPSPYVLDKEQGDVPQSSINVWVQLRNKPQQESSGGGAAAAAADGETTTTTTISLTLKDYLNVPPPRTTQLGCVTYMLAEQYPEEIKDPNDITSIMFMPFVAGGGIIKGGRSSSGVEECNKTSSLSSSSSSVISSTLRTNGDVASSSASSPTNQFSPSSKVQWAANKQEQSLRWSYFRVPDEKPPNNS